MARFNTNAQISFTIPNAKAARSLAKATQLVQEMAEGQEWNADLQRAARLLRKAVKGLRLDSRTR